MPDWRMPTRMARLTYHQRQALPDSAFAIPETREYPIEDRPHARDALSRVSAYGSPWQRRRVRSQVRKRYPSMQVSG